MALRNFTDSAGHGWRVWNVVPQYGPGRDDDKFTPGLEGGWLCFENDTEKRRLWPIPHAWESAESGELERLCHEAKPVTRPSGVF